MAEHYDDIASSSGEFRNANAVIDDTSSFSSRPAAIKLTAKDIPGADLKEPFETHGVPALQWWLLCRGIKAPSSWRKSQLIDRLVNLAVASLLD